MVNQEKLHKLVADIYADLGVQVSPDDPIVLLVLKMQEQHEQAVQSFKEEQQSYLKQITTLISKKKKTKWAGWWNLVNSFLCIGILVSIWLK